MQTFKRSSPPTIISRWDALVERWGAGHVMSLLSPEGTAGSHRILSRPALFWDSKDTPQKDKPNVTQGHPREPTLTLKKQ